MAGGGGCSRELRGEPEKGLPCRMDSGFSHPAHSLGLPFKQRRSFGDHWARGDQKNVPPVATHTAGLFAHSLCLLSCLLFPNPSLPSPS